MSTYRNKMCILYPLSVEDQKSPGKKGKWQSPLMPEQLWRQINPLHTTICVCKHKWHKLHVCYWWNLCDLLWQIFKQDVLLECEKNCLANNLLSLSSIWHHPGTQHLCHVSFRQNFIQKSVNKGKRKHDLVFQLKCYQHEFPVVNVQYFHENNHQWHPY